MSFPHYPKYKDSGVEWLGAVPEHWETCLLKRAFRSVDYGISDSLDSEGAVAILRMGNIANGKVVTDDLKYTDSVDPALILRHGDLLYNRTNSLDLIGKVGMFVGNGESPVSFASYLVRLRTVDKSLPDYFAYLLNTDGILSLARANAFVAIGQCNLNPTRYGQITVAIPPLTEQTRIAEFLDRETGKIDELVAEQRRLMELLNEQIISLVLSSFHAPATTELRLSEASTIISRPVIQKADENYTRIGLFNRGRGLFHKDASEMDDMGESDFFWVEEEDLIISGQFAWEGAVALADKEDTGCVVSHRYPVIRGKSGIALTEYLLGLFCTKHGDFLLNENSRGAAGRNRPLNISSLMKEKIPVPSMGVQEAVARAVHARKVLFKEIAKAIALLQERRTALISAAVTGQIDVRNVNP